MLWSSICLNYGKALSMSSIFEENLIGYAAAAPAKVDAINAE
jgi:hypothetical protein